MVIVTLTYFVKYYSAFETETLNFPNYLQKTILNPLIIERKCKFRHFSSRILDCTSMRPQQIY